MLCPTASRYRGPKGISGGEFAANGSAPSTASLLRHGLAEASTKRPYWLAHSLYPPNPFRYSYGSVEANWVTGIFYVLLIHERIDIPD